jgi:alginate O-acetyltransferase complex protein AlgI
VVFNLALLFFFKYWNFLAGTLTGLGLNFMPVIETLPLPFGGSVAFTLPIGISFYTFQTMSYTIDVYRGDAKAQKSILNFGTFVTLFPQLIAGPIIKYKDLGEQIDHRDYRVEQFASGAQSFVVGLAKKVLLANNVGLLWETCQALSLDKVTVAGAWLGVLAYAFQIYFDFSGYSDMAVGLGRMLGFEFLPNFNYPYLSRSVTEFWRRWHISLGTWFKEYLYIPLGGSRVKPARRYLNLLLVWAATGIWHGASWNFLLWGLYFGLILILEKRFILHLLERLPAWVGHCYTLILVLISWALFAITDFSSLLAYWKVMFGFGGVPLVNETFFYFLKSYLPLLAVAAVASTPLAKNLYGKLPRRAAELSGAILLLAGLILSVAYLVDGTYNPFLYFRF